MESEEKSIMDCIFCEIASGNIPGSTIYENDQVRVILDINPVSYGHALVLPKTHCDSLLECPDETRNAVFEAAARVGRHMEEVLGCDGINVLTNVREGAGQTVNHFHVHLIPRYSDQRKPDALDLSFGENEPMDLEVIRSLLEIRED